jgi:hypothetical protein
VTDYKLGRLPATRPHGLRDLAVYATGPLPAPPEAVAVPKASYPMDGNSQFGCCVAAAVAHLDSAWDAEVDEPDPIPDESQVVSTYFQLTGGQDTGLNEATVLQIWRTQGLFGRKIAAYAPVDPRDITELHQAVAFYGGSMLGITCPVSAQQQFAAGDPWTFVPDSQIAGGHAIVALGYTPTALLCATWGGIAQVTYPFLAHYLDEAWAIVPSQFVEAGRGPRMDLATLQADLDRV